MGITSAFKEAVSARNIRRIRIMMKDSLLNDPTFSEFNSMNEEISNLTGLYERHDGRNLDYDKAKWNDDYMNKLMVQVVGNFSQERIKHLKEVVKYLRPVINSSDKETNSHKRNVHTDGGFESNNSEHKSRQQHDTPKDEQLDDIVKLGVATVFGAIAGAGIAVLVKGSIVVGAVTGIAIGAASGIISIAVGKRKE